MSGKYGRGEALLFDDDFGFLVNQYNNDSDPFHSIEELGKIVELIDRAPIDVDVDALYNDPIFKDAGKMVSLDELLDRFKEST